MLVDMLVKMNPELYGPKVVFEKGKKVLCVQVLRAIYGMLDAALLYYKKFCKDLEEIGFKFNPHDACVANKKVQGRRLTVCFHVDDLKVSHVITRVVDDFIQWAVWKYGDPEIGDLKITRGKKHDFLAMHLDYSVDGEVRIDMRDYINQMVDEFPVKLDKNDTATTPANDNLFNVDKSKPLDKTRKETFHAWVAKGLFVSHRARPDMQTAMAVLRTKVQEPNESDWNKSMRSMKWWMISRS